MEFYTVFSEKRPVRLSEETRSFAYESLQGRYGDEAMSNPYVVLDGIEGYEKLSAQEKYNAAIKEIALKSPLRVCENEKVSGAATLGHAIYHVVPAYYKGEAVCGSVSHLTVDFPTVVFKGIDHLEAEINKRLEEEKDPARIEQLLGMKNAVEAMHIWHNRYLELLKSEGNPYYEVLKNVPFRPATSFKEAVQSIWFTFAFIRLCGNWPGIGRLDEMLGGFLENDLKNKKITLPEAREFLAGMFIKGCEWIQSDTPVGSGDAQHYQNIILGGVGVDGKEVTNDVTYLVLDIVEELAISDFPITVRVNENTPDKLLTRVAEVMRHGGGVIAVYNEPLILRSLVDFGYSESEAKKFANDGCWEVQIPGKTYFTYTPFDSLKILLNSTLRLDTDSPACFNSFGELYSEFLKNLKSEVERIYNNVVSCYFSVKKGENYVWAPTTPCSVVSLFEHGCIDRGMSYLGGGADYNVVSPHIGGAPDVGNSLYAIDRLVFKEKKISFADLMSVLKNDWEDNELLRQYVRNKYVYYGNDNDESDGYTVKVLSDFANIVSLYDKKCPVRFPAGVSTFGRQIEWRAFRGATPFGNKKGDILSGNASPTPGTDYEGATAVIRSYCKSDLASQTCGAALDVKLLPSTVNGENGVDALKSLIKGFVELGGFFMQLDIADEKILLEARRHPEKYKTLSVRVSGWNARFVTLNDDWQQMIIERTAQKL